MKLNIYQLSHPIITKLAHDINYSLQISRKQYDDKNKMLNLLLIYEVVRKWIKLQNIYIKHINYVKECCIFDKSESYLIITDFIENYNTISEAIELLPNTNIKHIALNSKKKIYIG